MLCVPSAPCTGGAVLFSTEQIECRSAVGLHILESRLDAYFNAHTLQTETDFQRLTQTSTLANPFKSLKIGVCRMVCPIIYAPGVAGQLRAFHVRTCG